jgi:hypothetical protein
MPCIKKHRTNNYSSPQGYCGKTLHANTPSFRDIKDAYSGDKPICPQCRKVLNLEKKVIDTRITSYVFNSLDLELTLHFNNKDNIKLAISFDITNGYSLHEESLLTEDESKYVSERLKDESLKYAKLSIPRLKFDEKDIVLLQKLIAQSENKGEIEQLLKMKNNIAHFVLRNK